jgi:hypothetical protein
MVSPENRLGPLRITQIHKSVRTLWQLDEMLQRSAACFYS